MASIFTFDHDPPRVHSPWQSGQDSGKRPQTERSVTTGAIVEAEQLSDPHLERLEAEPQDGPIEYKLHLLLRPRRVYNKMSTTLRVSGSQQSRPLRESKHPRQGSLPLAASNQTRQNRLHHLTTQLLWRLQQSSPYHSNARRELILPRLPEDIADLAALEKPQQLLPGLEESNGALYEIGVADDGTFVGLTKDEMDESMTTLKVMAASLGCRVEVQRMKAVGNCEWLDSTSGSSDQIHIADLWVAEALVMPVMNTQSNRDGQQKSQLDVTARRGVSVTEQLRISLIGPTTSGKTTLLGTLSNGTLDNGRGSSRINLLRHRHEVVSGRTSSIAQELIGYDDRKIFNYNVDNINEWPDIHDRAESGRLVFLLDSAGHPRYQRTTLRALVGWAPHWTLLCIPANEDGNPASGVHSLSGADSAIGVGIASMDLAMTHLDLCLKLAIPLAILITKSELGQRALLKDKLNIVFTKVKAMGRMPKLLTSTARDEDSLTEVSENDMQKVKDEIIDPIAKSTDPLSIVPIILTSAVKGIGIGLTHALLRSLPVPPLPTARDFVPLALNPEQPAALFHIDEVFEMSLSRAQSTASSTSGGSAPVVTGYLRFGRLSIGDRVVLGPFPGEDEDADALVPKDYPSPGYGLSIPHPSSAEFARLSSRHTLSASKLEGEWRQATIVNIRDLRLPVQTIEAGQAGSIQVVFNDLPEESSDINTTLETPRISSARLRKGQVLAVPSQHMVDTGLSLQAASSLIASFKTSDVKLLTVNTLVNAYVGMVRAAVRVLGVRRQKSDFSAQKVAMEDNDDVFNMNDHIELERSKSEADLDEYHAEYHVSLEFLNNREWIELGSQIVLVEGSSKDKLGFEGYVGRVIEIGE
ncbi:GTP-binding protein 2 [Daldinia childiae]|uniref:GTP-binding protein 2 n=1 Tax=Daldinia childiae TaxID=326645 RepID=UPI0014483D06|nr:GTP-binding protein 2 [Daldinia childiae]KAF3055709.1 GTP-binding protein 2 [Daldinia childiae]